MSGRPLLHGCESAIRLMASTLLLPPAVDPSRVTACVDRWREQRIADVAIDEFGDEARAQAGDRLFPVTEGDQQSRSGLHADDRRCNCAAISLGHPLAGDVARVAPIPPAEARLARVSGKTFQVARHAV